MQVILKARGQGNTAYCAQNLRLVNFGTQFTCTDIVKEILLENKGRKAQRIQWNRVRTFVDPTKLMDKNVSKSTFSGPSIPVVEQSKSTGKGKGEKE